LDILTKFGEGKALRFNMYKEEFEYSWSVSSLAADTEYVLYCTFQDLGDNLSPVYAIPFFTE
jgi:hypothetical protein